jgi:hypothetical protein
MHMHMHMHMHMYVVPTMPVTDAAVSSRWADEDAGAGAAGSLCLVREFLAAAPPCPDAFYEGQEQGQEADYAYSYAPADGGGEGESGRDGGMDIDLSIDPRHTHNLLLMKKKEHEGKFVYV